MPLYVLANQHADTLDTIVFHAGESNDQEAVAIFTEMERAERYLREAEWETQHRATPLEPLALLQWLVQADAQQVALLTVDPERRPHMAGRPQAVFSIRDELERCGEQLEQRLSRCES